MLGFREILFHHHWWRVNHLLVQDKPKTRKFHQRHGKWFVRVEQISKLPKCVSLYTEQSLWGGFAAKIPVKLLLEVKCCFKTSRRFVKLLSVSVPENCGLYSVHVMPFFELEFFLIAASLISCFADEFADGASHLRAMLVHAFSSGIKINWCKL